ncbi:O-antigen ligase family protein [Pandoraea bronchicola]|uniref:O-antigen ligase domain-containing protein n=1 Tax=Pandoraea bronchicola TaxID=2508287 RepID=A0A5E5BUN0_9BURK|nr:hypothetical protein [Pandoraea bronchicola]VVE89037.1 hypothetical protein PBR20603_03002 [Pandoraea bronchicola]
MALPSHDFREQPDSVSSHDAPPSAAGSNASFAFKFSTVLFGIIVLLNFATLLYPSLAPGQDPVGAIRLALSRYVTPVTFLLITLLTVNLAPRAAGTDRNVVVWSLVVFAAYLCSLVNNTFSASSAAIACFFPLAVFVVFIFSAKLTRFHRVFLKAMTWTLAAWVVAPIVFLAFPWVRTEVLSTFEWSFHGFSPSRIEFGLWSGMFTLLLWFGRAATPRKAYLTLMTVTLILIYFAQSRAAIISIAMAFSYYVFSSDLSWQAKFRSIAIIIVVTGLIALSWKIFGRQEPFEMFNSTRLEITQQIIKSSEKGNSWVGAGGMVSVVTSDGTVTQAHNLILQWIANWGGLGTVALFGFLFAAWHWLRSVEARMLYLMLAVFSMTQPVQGTANFFGPLTLAWFFVFVCVEINTLGPRVPQRGNLETFIFPRNRPHLTK